MVHVMRFNGIGSAPLEQSFAKRRIVDYVVEVESGVFKPNDRMLKGVNMIEVHVPGASKINCSRLEQEWRQLLSK